MIEGYFIGLISGTSQDGVDAALVLFEDDRPHLLHAFCLPYPEPLRSDLATLLSSGRKAGSASGGVLDEFLGRHFARAARMVAQQGGIEMRDVAAIGLHGQTVWHDPDGDPPASVQLGSAEVLLRSTATTVVSRFRQADLDAGGQGAPLAPLLHRRLFYTPAETRAVLNLGGIANITLMGPNGRVTGFDTGPANCLLDLWTRMNLAQPFDRGGEWAASGQLVPDLLDEMLADPYFVRPAPKSTGLEYFNLAWLERSLSGRSADAADIQCTLAELTARSAAAAVEAATAPVHRLLICGGGVHNLHLMKRLARLLPDTTVESTQRHGVHPEWVEALLFAWLARERLCDRPQDTRLITGAREPALLGEIRHPARH